ncbi:MAG: response regulator [Crocinitomicaceae bacterium]|nr:response regulator [Crocinitomicaceae bacterium]
MKTINTSAFIVEDDRLYAEIIRSTLTNEGYKDIQIFGSGDDFLRHSNSKPDIVILDHMLGQMSGIHILRTIQEKMSDVKVIFLSAQEDMEVVVKALKLGAFDYIEKTDPNAMTRLVVMMKKAIRARDKSKKSKRVERLKGWFLIS